MGSCTSDGVVSSILRTDSAVSVPVEARHRLLGEECEGLLEDFDCTHEHVSKHVRCVTKAHRPRREQES